MGMCIIQSIEDPCLLELAHKVRISEKLKPHHFCVLFDRSLSAKEDMSAIGCTGRTKANRCPMLTFRRSNSIASSPTTPSSRIEAFPLLSSRLEYEMLCCAIGIPDWR